MMKCKAKICEKTFAFFVSSSEIKKFLALALLMFTIVYNYSLLDSVREMLIVISMGAEAINILDFYGVLPAVFLLTLLYIKMTNHLTRASIFYVFSIFFLIFYLIFAFYLYPNQDQLHWSDKQLQSYIASLPALKWQLMTLGKWPFSLFYIVTELWCAMMLNLLFWEFANHITTLKEAIRYYPLLGILSNIAVILSGYSISMVYHSDAYQLDHNDILIQIIISLISISCILGMTIYFWINRHLLDQNKSLIQVGVPASLLGNLRMIVSSKQLRQIALLILFYVIAMSLVDSSWRAALREMYPTEKEYAHFLGTFLKWKGFTLIPFMLLGSALINRLGWFVGAMTTPVIMLTTGLVFYILLILQFLFGIHTVAVVSIGAVQIILSKASKYTLFDSTKEMLYIPLDQALRTKGKSAVDMTGSRLFRSISAFLQSLIFMLFPTLTYYSISPYFMIFFIGVIGAWFVLLRNIRRQFDPPHPPCRADEGDQ